MKLVGLLGTWHWSPLYSISFYCLAALFLTQAAIRQARAQAEDAAA